MLMFTTKLMAHMKPSLTAWTNFIHIFDTWEEKTTEIAHQPVKRIFFYHYKKARISSAATNV